MESAPSSLFGDQVTPTPANRFREPRFVIEPAGNPAWELVDDMGCVHTLRDGAIIQDARFSGWNLAGVLLRDLEIDTVALANCRLANFEIQRSILRRFVVSACEGGMVLKSASVHDAKFEAITDPAAVIRLFDCEVANLLVSNCKCAIDIAKTRGVGVVLQHCNFAGRAGAIRSSTLRATRVVHCTFTAMYIFHANLLHSELAACAFVDCYWEDVELSFSQLIDSTLTDCRVRNLRLDGSGVRTLHLSNTRVLDLSAAFSDIFDIEVVGGGFGASFDRTQIRSLMLWRVRAQLSMKESRVFGLRLCAVDGIVGGSDTTWWLPVIRRSALRGDGTRGITLLDADCTNTQITNDFGIWTKNTATIDRLDTL